MRRSNGDRITVWRGEADVGEVWVVKTGVGPARAAAAAAQIDLAACALVVSTGCAGGLAPTLRAGDLVVASAVESEDAIHPTDPATRAQLHALATAGGLPMREGVMRCSATMLASRADKHAAAAGGALAVEMEG
ncbi:MAG TPA: hypothetical protein VL049_04780, partial [Candidatus Dormibacteraeota bacterium]|nr:hypothetical protein [Candidatus Dormibacteraeota bacterium]